MFQVERLNVIAKTIDQIGAEISEGKVDNNKELAKALKECLTNITALGLLLEAINITESEEQTDENS